MNESLRQTERLLKTIRRLRKECPWDKVQTHQTLTRYLVEEAFEAVEAIQSKNYTAMQEELGDVLLQVVLHAEIASEKKKFDFEKIAKALADKMIERHPHVFTPKKLKNAKAVQEQWADLKKKKGKKSLLEGTPKTMPALMLAQRYGEKASGVNFDWQNAEQVFEKIEEEVAELKASKNKKDREEEFGDVLFTVVQWGRHLGLDAEEALKKACKKFETRFSKMESKVKSGSFKAMNFEEKEKLWEEVK